MPSALAIATDGLVSTDGIVVQILSAAVAPPAPIAATVTQPAPIVATVTAQQEITGTVSDDSIEATAATSGGGIVGTVTDC